MSKSMQIEIAYYSRHLANLDDATFANLIDRFEEFKQKIEANEPFAAEKKIELKIWCLAWEACKLKENIAYLDPSQAEWVLKIQKCHEIVCYFKHKSSPAHFKLGLFLEQTGLSEERLTNGALESFFLFLKEFVTLSTSPSYEERAKIHRHEP